MRDYQKIGERLPKFWSEITKILVRDYQKIGERLPKNWSERLPKNWSERLPKNWSGKFLQNFLKDICRDQNFSPGFSQVITKFLVQDSAR